ncbi:MAG TPA: hypothetical protein PKD91_03430 [Bacteroidia bacterium]|nr:hypothetical protein [Bacteroidia bacterium]
MRKTYSKKLFEEQLRIENQIRRLKLELKHGVNFGFYSTDKQYFLPPKLEKIVLDSVELFDKKLQESKSKKKIQHKNQNIHKEIDMKSGVQKLKV